MALRLATTAKTETDANKPTDAITPVSAASTQVDFAVESAKNGYRYSTEIMFDAEESAGVVSVEQSDRTLIPLDDLMRYIVSQGYSCAYERYNHTEGLKVKVKLGWV